MTNEELVKKALSARQQAYAPYSGYAVGAALLSTDGEVFTGCNVESASYSATICAERVALVNAVSGGKRHFSKLAVAGPGSAYCTPCGICRQMLHEFSKELVLLCANEHGQYTTHTLAELLPFAFGAEAIPDEKI